MIGKVSIGKSFGGVVRYVMEKAGAEVLDMEGVIGLDAASATGDFNAIRRQHASVKNAVWHTSISFAYQDEVSNQTMLKIAHRYLEEIGLKDHQYLIVRHHDTQHEHLHIVSNRIGYNGEIISDKFCKNRTASVCDRLEEEFRLTVAREQGRGKKTVPDKLPIKRRVKAEIRMEIEGLLRVGISSFDRLKEELAKAGIETRLQVQRTGRVNGITFSKDDIAIKGSAVDKEFSYGRLKQKLDQNGMEQREQRGF